MDIRNERIKITAHFHEQGSVLRGDAESFCDAFEIEITLDSNEDPRQIAELVRLSRQMCFTEKALMGSTPVHVTAFLNGDELQG